MDSSWRHCQWRGAPCFVVNRHAFHTNKPVHLGPFCKNGSRLPATSNQEVSPTVCPLSAFFIILYQEMGGIQTCFTTDTKLPNDSASHNQIDTEPQPFFLRPPTQINRWSLVHQWLCAVTPKHSRARQCIIYIYCKYIHGSMVSTLIYTSIDECQWSTVEVKYCTWGLMSEPAGQHCQS